MICYKCKLSMKYCKCSNVKYDNKTNFEEEQKNTYKKKIKALLEGLDIQNIDYFMKFGKTGDYRKLGIAYLNSIKEKIKENDVKED